MTRFILLSCLCLLVTPALAASNLKKKDVEAIVERAFPGEVTSVNREGKIYEVDLEQEDGTRLEIEVDRKTGAILEVEIEKFGKFYKDLRKDFIKDREAKDNAKDYARARLGQLKKLEIKRVNDLLVNGRYVYGIDMEVGKGEYRVLVNPVTGDVEGFETLDD